MKTIKFKRTAHFFATILTCTFLVTNSIAQTTTEPAILERTAKGLQIA